MNMRSNSGSKAAKVCFFGIAAYEAQGEVDRNVEYVDGSA
jgi:hypothetical protein